MKKQLIKIEIECFENLSSDEGIRRCWIILALKPGSAPMILAVANIFLLSGLWNILYHASILAVVASIPLWTTFAIWMLWSPHNVLPSSAQREIKVVKVQFIETFYRTSSITPSQPLSSTGYIYTIICFSTSAVALFFSNEFEVRRVLLLARQRLRAREEMRW